MAGRICAVLGTALLLLVAPAVASAQAPGPVSPEGVSEAQQYAPPPIPGVAGEVQVDLGAAPPSGTPAEPTAVGQQPTAVGQQVRRFAEATGVAGRTGLVEEYRVGWLLPALLTLILLTGIGYLVMRRRVGGPSTLAADSSS